MTLDCLSLSVAPLLQCALAVAAGIGIELGPAVFAAAARAERLPILECLLAHGCPWDAYVTAAAAGSGRLVALQWLHERGCPWDETVTAAARDNGFPEVVAWARQAGCP